MEDWLDDSYWNDSGIGDVITSVDNIDTGNSNSDSNVDTGNDGVVTWDNLNAPSVINNNSSDDMIPPDLNALLPSQNSIDGYNNIVNSMATNPDGSNAYDPFSNAQTDFMNMLDKLLGIDGPTQVNAQGSSKPGSKSASSGSSGGSSLGSLGQAAAKALTPSNAPATSAKPTNAVTATQPANTGITSAKQAQSNVTGLLPQLNLTTISLVLGILVSLIMLYLFMKKGRA